MTLRDLVVISTGNLWRMKLRAFLTIAGVVIAIAAFVSMISFGAGNQEYVEKEYTKLGLFTTMQVFPREGSDTSHSPRLDRAAIDRLAALPGVNLVYPYETVPVKIRRGDSTADSRAQSLSAAAMKTKVFSTFMAGGTFAGDSAKEAIISQELVKSLGFSSPESAIGKSIVLSVRISTLDSGFAHIIRDRGELIWNRAKKIRVDSLKYPAYRSRTIRKEANELIRRFLAGYLSAKETISDTLVICGVRETQRRGRLRVEPVIIPYATASKFSTSGFSGSPVEILSRMSSGSLFSLPGDDSGKSFSQATVDFDPKVLYTAIRDSVEKMGYRTFSFAEQFEEMQKFFFYFDLALGVVGMIALTTASLGIINTMVMSISERRKEIGVLKSLGAGEPEIRALFLVESGIIGVFGTCGGIFSGWLITRIVSLVARAYMKREGLPSIDLFALPPWLLLIALAVGIGVSMIAGYYPAARAAKVDPVAALRNE